MRTCKICSTPIEHLHGNAETCIACMKKPNAKRVITRRKEYITMTYERYQELQRLAAIGKHHENDRKVCDHCFKCNSLNGICQKYGCPNTEVH